jgi:uncharacterized protein
MSETACLGAHPSATWPWDAGGGRAMPIDKELLAILACPKCKGDIRLSKDGNGLVCEACRLLYEIRDNIPVMLIDEAVKLDDPTHV